MFHFTCQHGYTVTRVFKNPLFLFPKLFACIKHAFSKKNRARVDATSEGHSIHLSKHFICCPLEGMTWSMRRPGESLSLFTGQCCKSFDGMCVTGLSRPHSPRAFIVVWWQGQRHLVRVPGVTGSAAGSCKAPGNTIYHCHKTNHPHQQRLSSSGEHDTH